MERINNCVDREMAMRLLKHGVFLSERVKPISRPEALVLLAEAKLDRFVSEFKGVVQELLSGCQLSDFQVTSAERDAWFGEAPGPAKGGITESCGWRDGRERRIILEVETTIGNQGKDTPHGTGYSKGRVFVNPAA
jgi:hypothetical protein